jgi:predicted exporter
MVILLFRALVVSTLVVVTQVLPTMVTLGTMGWAGIPLDLVTVMIASISMGVGIDASIQYAWRHRFEQRGTPDPEEAVRRTHATVGRAIWIATTVIVCGFLVLVLSDFKPSVWLGVLNAVAMIVSQLSALTVLPALLFLRRENPAGQRMQLFLAALQGEPARGQIRRPRFDPSFEPLVDFLQKSFRMAALIHKHDRSPHAEQTEQVIDPVKPCRKIGNPRTERGGNDGQY